MRQVLAASLAAIAFGAPFTPGNIALLRAGDGVATLGTGAARGEVLEVNPSDGSIVRT